MNTGIAMGYKPKKMNFFFPPSVAFLEAANYTFKKTMNEQCAFGALT